MVLSVLLIDVQLRNSSPSSLRMYVRSMPVKDKFGRRD